MSAQSSRRRGRKLAFQTLYGLSFNQACDLEALRKAFEFSLNPDSNGVDTDYAWQLVTGVWLRQKELDNIIDQLSLKWRVSRMGRIELTILRLSLFEMASSNTPVKTAIKDALDLAEHFGVDGARSLIYGILDAAGGEQKAKSVPDIQKSCPRDEK